jgi:hypothetical protein
VLPDGDTFVGWGSQGDFSEIAPDGALRFDAHLPDGYDTYRAYRQPWTGTPDTHPSVAAVARAKRLHVYASWKNATQVASRQVLTGAGADALAPDGPPAPRPDLETAIALPSVAAFVAGSGLAAHGHLLGTSRPVRVTGA